MIYNLPNGNRLIVWSNCPAGLLRVTLTRYVLKLTGDDILTIICWLLSVFDLSQWQLPLSLLSSLTSQ